MFKKIFFVFAVLAFFMFSGNSVFAQTDQNKSWDFNKWAVDININNDSTFIVRETQTFDFHGNYHWVQRDISKNKVRSIGDIKVFDEDGKELIAPDIEVTEDAVNVSVRINFDLTDTQKTWIFQYKVSGGLGYFEDHDELYWNAVSSERDVPIGAVEVLVHLPESVDKGKMMETLYTGPAGNNIPSENYEIVDGKTFKFWGSDIGPYENFTIVAGWPKGVVFEPGILKINSNTSAAVIIDGKNSGFTTPAVLEEDYEISPGEHKISVKKFGWAIKGGSEESIMVEEGKVATVSFEIEKASWFALLNDLFYVIPLFVGIFLFKKYKSAPRIKKTIIAQYEPPEKLSPAEVGGLVYGAVRSKDLTATLIDLAYRGYLKIIEREEKVLWSNVKKYTLVKKKPFRDDASLLPHEEKILEAIFGLSKESVEVGDLKDESSFRQAVMKLPREILKKMVGKELYFSSTPMPKMSGCILAIVLIPMAIFLVPFIIAFSAGISLGNALLLSLLIFIVYLALKPQPLTERGVEAKWYALGFKEYLQVAERFRLGACTPETFEKYLSYAMVLGVERQWAARFADIYKTQPDWYESDHPISGFNSVVFASALSGMTASVGAAVSYSSPSGSSGFGGGGGAGGGGGGGGSSAG